MMQLYFIVQDNGDGDSLDLLVVAETREQAVQLWREYYGLSADDTDGLESDFGFVPYEPKTVFLVSAAQVAGPARALAWNTDVQEVK